MKKQSVILVLVVLLLILAWSSASLISAQEPPIKPRGTPQLCLAFWGGACSPWIDESGSPAYSLPVTDWIIARFVEWFAFLGAHGDDPGS